MTRDQIIHQRRVRVLEHAGETGNVAETCRVFGISRKTFYEWRRLSDAYGLEALMPKARRRPQLANATPTHVSMTCWPWPWPSPHRAARPAGCSPRRPGLPRVQDHGAEAPRRSRHGPMPQRVARAAALAALVGGLVSEPVAEKVFGFCHWAGRPGDLVAVDSFYIGKLEGVGKVYQLTAVDTATR